MSGSTSAFRKLKKLMTSRDIRRNMLLRLTPALLPRLHCKLQIRYGYYHPENPIDLKHPRLFNEKLLWLRYYLYNKSPLVQRCYDKYLVRDYVKEQGLDYILNELYGVWDRIEDIPWDSLPDRYALKATNGCGGHTFRTHGETVDTEAAAKRLLRVEERRKTYQADGILFASRGKQHYICEKLMTTAAEDFPNDYKFYCFHGEPVYVLWITDRFKETGHIETYKTLDWQDCSDICVDSEPVEIPKPSCYEEMIRIARKLSAPFPFVRVDLYDIDGKPVFGELTFDPGGTHTPYYQKTMGDMIRMDSMEHYKKILFSK